MDFIRKRKKNTIEKNKKREVLTSPSIDWASVVYIPPGHVVRRALATLELHRDANRKGKGWEKH